MGKFAGFLKRIKRLAGIGSGILNTVNTLYKSVKPAADGILSMIPGGKEVLPFIQGASSAADYIHKNTPKDWATKYDKGILNSMDDTAQKIGGFLMNSPLKIADRIGNSVLDSVESYRSPNFGNGAIFGEPLN